MIVKNEENTETKQLITKEKKDAVVTHWVQKATSKDNQRGILNGINRENGKLAAADGFRFHMANTPECWENLSEGTYKVNEGKSTHKTPGRIYDLEEIKGTFPDFNLFVPDIKDSEFIFAIDRSLLTEAVKDMPMRKDTKNEIIKMYFTHPNHPVLITNSDDSAQALVMPLNLKISNSEKNDTKILERIHAKQKSLTLIEYIRENHFEIYQEAKRETRASKKKSY